MPSLDHAPELLPEAAPYMSAYEMLATRRTFSSAGPNPLPMSDIWAYVQLNAMQDQDEIDDLVRFTIMLDTMSCEALRKEWGKKSGKG